MSKEFQDRLTRGELTDTEDYQRMKDTLNEANSSETKKDATTDDSKSSQDWKNWDLSPVWSASDAGRKKPVADNGIREDSVHRALDLLDKY